MFPIRVDQIRMLAMQNRAERQGQNLHRVVYIIISLPIVLLSDDRVLISWSKQAHVPSMSVILSTL